MIVAVIPARGGSKRIPCKNIRPFHGKPMMAWSIEAAKASGCFERIVVSTDDVGIADVARSCGADVPFLRPPELADDLTGTVPVIAHAVAWLDSEGWRTSEVCCIYPTAPFLRPEDLRRGLEALRASDCPYSLSVTAFPYPIQRALCISDAGRLRMFDPTLADVRSQDLVPAWHDAGQFYWGRASAWKKGLPILSSAPVPVVLPRHRVQDIDTPEDWSFAELLFDVLRSRELDR